MNIRFIHYQTNACQHITGCFNPVSKSLCDWQSVNRKESNNKGEHSQLKMSKTGLDAVVWQWRKYPAELEATELKAGWDQGLS